MSIASRIESIENHLSNDYIEIARLGTDLTNVDKNIENIAETIREAYSKMPKVLGTGSSLSLSPTLKGGLDITPIGKCEQDSYSGKNLIDRTTCLENRGLGWANGTITAVANNLTSDFFEVEINQNYTNNYIGGIFFYDTNKDYLGAYQNDGNIGKYGSDFRGNTFLVPNNNDIKYVRIVFRGDWNDNINILTANVQTEKGSTATSYEPYVGGIPSPNPNYPQDVRVVTGDNDVVVQNKNLINSVETHKYITSTGNMLTGEKYLGIEDYVNIQPNTTYAVSFEHDVVASTLYIGYKDKNNSFISRVNVGSNRTFTTPNNAVKCIFYLYDGTTEFATIGGYVQLEYGDTPTTYIAHAEQKVTLHNVPNLAGINDYKDEIVGKTDNWKVVRKVGKVVFNGTENWSINNTGTENFYYRYRYISNNRYTGGSGTFLCNEFSFAQVGNSTTDEGMFITQVGEIRVRFGTEMTIEDFKTWLSTHNIILYYQLETPTEETITDTTLINDLNNMYNLMGYDGQTNVTITSNSANAQMTASVSALKGE